jgi:hypothetical protein
MQNSQTTFNSFVPKSLSAADLSLLRANACLLLLIIASCIITYFQLTIDNIIIEKACQGFKNFTFISIPVWLPVYSNYSEVSNIRKVAHCIKYGEAVLTFSPVVIAL